MTFNIQRLKCFSEIFQIIPLHNENPQFQFSLEIKKNIVQTLNISLGTDFMVCLWNNSKLCESLMTCAVTRKRC